MSFCGSAFSANYYVSPSGSDANSGSLSAPFQTLARAVTAAQAGDTVYLRQGVYRQSLLPIRSGTAGSPIVFSGYPGEDAVLCGTNLVTGTWTPYQGGIYRITGAAPTTALFVDGHMMQEARWPNAPVDSYFSNYATCGSGTTATQVVDPNLPALNLNGARVHIIPGLSWVSNTSGVTNYGGGSFQFTSAIGSSSAYQPQAGNLYYLYGSLALLDSPGEWFQDPNTNTIYLWAPDGASPATHLVEEAARKEVFTANALNYLRVQDLFTFGGGINFVNCNYCAVDGVNQKYTQHYTEVSGFSAEGDHNGFYGGGNNSWSNGSIQYSAGNGLLADGTGVTVTDMVISDVCYIATYRGCIQSEGSNNDIEYNTLHDSGRYCVWHDQTSGGSISHNEMYNAGLVTRDVGATYAYKANGKGLVISYNQIHDTHIYLGNGIYLDNGCSNFLVHHNVVYNCDNTAVVLNYPSLSNQCYNNTLANCKYWTGGSGSTVSQAGTSIINNLGVGTGSFRYLTGTNGAVFIDNGTYLPTSFVSGGYQLAAGSGAIDQGMVIPGITDGYYGAAPDVGAYEYKGATWSYGATVVTPTFPYPLSATQPTSTPSSTPTRTSTATPSSTPTSTRTASTTATPSATLTVPATSTFSMTPTDSATPTASMTASATPSQTSTASATDTSSATSTASFTSTATATATPTATSTFTSTASKTPTDSMTASPTASRTPTASFTMTGTPSLTASPTATSTATATATNSATPTATRTASSTPTSSWTPSFTPTRTPTATATSSFTSTFTSTFTPSFTPSATATMTSTFTLSPTPSVTPTVTLTPSSTPNSSLLTPNFTPVVYPNPSTGSGPVHLLLYLHQGGEVKVKLFTTAFRKVWQHDFPNEPAGEDRLVLDLPPTANGVYYLMVESDGKRWVVKLMVLG